MKFATIIREAGIATKLFPNVAEKLQVVLYDLDDNTTEDDVHYVEGLFDNNRISFCNFVNWLNAFESIMEMEFEKTIPVQITENYVTIYYNTPGAIHFRRTEPMEPIDYMV